MTLLDAGPDTARDLGPYDASSTSPGEAGDYLATSAGGSPELQALVELAAQVSGLPMAAINILTEDEQHMLATSGIAPSVCARSDAMCSVVATDPVVVVPDARADGRFARNPFVNGELDSIRMYASAPLVAPDGTTVGRLCVFDQRPGDLTAEQRESLASLATRVMDVLQLRLLTHRLEESLRELTVTRDELRRSNEHLSYLAGQISHDLRTPLTAVLANVEMLADEPTVAADDELAETVGEIARAGEHMRDLIEQVLGHARVGGTLHLSAVPLGEVFDRVLGDLAPLLRDGAEVHVGELPVVTCDRRLVYSVALNLMTNALKFTRPGVPARVRVRAVRHGSAWRVRVEDNGSGVAPEARESIFSPFSRAEDRVDGHGIGLATARRIVLAHGGRIGVEDSAGPGSTFWFELPA